MLSVPNWKFETTFVSSKQESRECISIIHDQMPTHVVPIPILVVLQWRVVIISHYIVDHHASVCPFDATVLFACGITVETLCYGTGSSTAIVICPQG